MHRHFLNIVMTAEATALQGCDRTSKTEARFLLDYKTVVKLDDTLAQHGPCSFEFAFAFTNTWPTPSHPDSQAAERNIPGIHAEPIIDILLQVDDVQALEARSSAMSELAYEAKGEFGIPGRHSFKKESATGIPTHHIHAFERGSPACERHLAIRDCMIAHPVIAQSYSLLKQRLAASHPDDITAYMEGKDSFIKEHQAMAIIWKGKAQPEGATNGSQPTSPKTDRMSEGLTPVAQPDR